MSTWQIVAVGLLMATTYAIGLGVGHWQGVTDARAAMERRRHEERGK